MLFVEIDLIKAQCKIDPDLTEEDELLQLYAEAAQEKALIYLNRGVYTDSVPETDPDGILINSSIKTAILGLACHYQRNRATVSDFEQSETPMFFTSLLSDYRKRP
ncbi:head-tail connector protein [Serratia microhaemolytica]|uniref:head-tail connector protein n=1 Tax=Serratia microhaemolytica TaxID=2675110 RepID=UPI001F0CD7F0|nr:head-tail connector protein [Serratia microhaemolytica]